jgi:hypothetical protein
MVSACFSILFHSAYGETIRDTAQAYNLTGTAENDRIIGSGGNDILVGLQGDGGGGIVSVVFSYGGNFAISGEIPSVTFHL